MCDEHEVIRLKAAKVADDLQGTCQSLDNVVEKHFPDDDLLNVDLFCHFLDNMVECCKSCDWWVETCEIDEDGNCGDCHVEEDEDE